MEDNVIMLSSKTEATEWKKSSRVMSEQCQRTNGKIRVRKMKNYSKTVKACEKGLEVISVIFQCNTVPEEPNNVITSDDVGVD